MATAKTQTIQRYTEQTEAPFWEYGHVTTRNGSLGWGIIGFQTEDEPASWAELTRLVEAEYMPEDFDSSKPYKESKVPTKDNFAFRLFLRDCQIHPEKHNGMFPPLIEVVEHKKEGVLQIVDAKKLPLSIKNWVTTYRSPKVNAKEKLRWGCTCTKPEPFTAWKRCGFCQYYGKRHLYF